MSVTFYRDRLKSKQARAFYDEVLGSIARGNLGGIFPLRFTNRATASRDAFDAMEALHYDRPEFFFLGKSSRTLLRGKRLVLMNEVTCTPEQIGKIRIRLERAMERFTAGTAGLTEWERERCIYERLVRYLTYEDHGHGASSKEYDHNVIGPLLQGSGVCEGFSCLLTLALRRVGIPCIRVNGCGRKEPHCWNLAWVEGSPVHLDITWERVDGAGNVCFSSFNLTDGQITRDHRITTKGLPPCVDATKGYHFRKKLPQPK